MRRAAVLAMAMCTVVAACTGAGSVDAAGRDDPTAATAAGSTASAVDRATARPSSAPGDGPLWRDVTADAIGETLGYTNRVELADIDADGDVDLLFADGGNYDGPGEPVVNQVFVNDGAAAFTDVSTQVWGVAGDISRVVTARDLDGDGLVDLLAGTTFETQSRLFLGRGGLTFEEVTDTHLPQVDASVGDVAIGDVDGDRDLDIALVDWGPGVPLESRGAPAMLWLNDGSGVFTDVSRDRVPRARIGFSWDLELVDADDDLDLDLAITCKTCQGSRLYENDGAGRFTDVSDRLPQFTNNYEFAVMDANGDGLVDMATLNDGDGLRNHLLVADGEGGFVDASPPALAADDERFSDDGAAVWLDHDVDGDADLLVGSLTGSDRLFVNDGAGGFDVVADVLGNTRGTLSLAVADLDGDDRPDVVEAQGEAATPEKVYLGAAIPPDTAPPVIGEPTVVDGTVHARVHDHISPAGAHQWRQVVVEGPDGAAPMAWYGEHLWRADVASAGEHRVCATDAAGNRACSDPVAVERGGG